MSDNISDTVDNSVSDVTGALPPSSKTCHQPSPVVVDGAQDDNRKRLPSEDAKSPANVSKVRDVIYDEHGQTWDVYGADFDPEILGQAIQV